MSGDGDKVILSDNTGIVSSYSLSTGQIENLGYGKEAAASSDGNTVISALSETLSLIDLSGPEPTQSIIRYTNRGIIRSVDIR